MNKNILSDTPKSPMAKAGRLMEVEFQIKKLTEEKNTLRCDLLKVTQDLGVLTLKTEMYTISRVNKMTQKVAGFKELKAYLDKKDIPYMTEEAFSENMKETFKQIAKKAREEKEIVPGLEINETEYIMIRMAEIGKN